MDLRYGILLYGGFLCLGIPDMWRFIRKRWIDNPLSPETRAQFRAISEGHRVMRG